MKTADAPYSASEIGTGRGCKRKHAFKYSTDLPRPPEGAGAALGKQGHKIQEGYLRDGTPPPSEGLGSLCRAGLPFLPPPKSGIVEGSLGGFDDKHEPLPILIDGIPFIGFMDWHGPANQLPGWESLAADVVAVLDHKFTKDPGRYGLWTEAQRLDDPQSIIYRIAPTVMYAIDPESVLLRWLYYPTGNGRKRPKPADHKIAYRAARGAFERVVLPVIEGVQGHRGRLVDPMTVEPNPGHCDAYGGCEYRALGLCTVTNSQVANSLFGGGKIMAEGQGNIWDAITPNGPPAAAQPAAPAFVFPGMQPATPPPAAQATAPAPFVFPGMQPPAPAAPPPVVAQAAPPAPTVAPASLAATGLPTPAAVQADVIAGRDPLVRIGHALIAAGRALAGV